MLLQAHSKFVAETSVGETSCRRNVCAPCVWWDVKPYSTSTTTVWRRRFPWLQYV